VSRAELAPEVRELLSRALDSFEKLEVVMHLQRVDALPVPLRDIAQEIGIREDIALEALAALTRADVLSKHENGWSLQRRGRWAEHLVALSRAADSDRTELLKFLTERAVSRVRAEAARVFADAFILRPKKKGGSDG
jgi:Mn-dependent DtxR family transcriptional regulator